MNTLIKTLCTVLLAAGVTSAFAEVQDRHLSGFHAIRSTGPVDVYITQGSTESVKVEAPDDIMDKIITEVNGDVLKIREKNGHFNWSSIFSNHNRKIAVYVTVKDIRSVELSGSGDVYFKDGLNAGRLQLSLSGSGDATGRVNVKEFDASTSGSGDMRLSGRAETANYSSNGSGDISARDLAAANVTVNTSGSGDASVNASQRIDIRTSGSGDVRYTGGAKQVSKHSSGSGDIHGS